MEIHTHTDAKQFYQSQYSKCAAFTKGILETVDLEIFFQLAFDSVFLTEFGKKTIVFNDISLYVFHEKSIRVVIDLIGGMKAFDSSAQFALLLMKTCSRRLQSPWHFPFTGALFHGRKLPQHEGSSTQGSSP